MIIWLKHPAHGIKCAYARNEAEEDKRNGWVEVPAPSAEPAEAEEPKRDVIKLKKA